jgi:hypothetical protein
VVIKILFAIMVLSVAALIGVALAVFLRVRSHLNKRRTTPGHFVEVPPESTPESST